VGFTYNGPIHLSIDSSSGCQFPTMAFRNRYRKSHCFHRPGHFSEMAIYTTTWIASGLATI